MPLSGGLGIMIVIADSFKKYMGELAEAMRQELPDVSDTRAEFMIDGVP